MTAAATTPAELPEYAGITRDECCFDCTAERCVITRANICGHPNKGGLQATHKGNPETAKRYNQVRRALAEAELRRKDFER